MSVVLGDGVMKRFPKPFYVVDQRMVSRLEDQFELRIIRQPPSGDITLVDDVVIDDEHNTPRSAVGALSGVEQMDEQQGVFAFVLGPHHRAGARMQSAGEIVFPVLSRRWNGALRATGHPGWTDSWVEVDIGFVGEKDLGMGVFIGQRLGNGLQSL